MFEDAREASLRAYTESRALGSSDIQAFQTATRVLRLRFPKVDERAAADAVAEWICEDQGE